MGTNFKIINLISYILFTYNIHASDKINIVKSDLFHFSFNKEKSWDTLDIRNKILEGYFNYINKKWIYFISKNKTKVEYPFIYINYMPIHSINEIDIVNQIHQLELEKIEEQSKIDTNILLINTLKIDTLSNQKLYFEKILSTKNKGNINQITYYNLGQFGIIVSTLVTEFEDIKNKNEGIKILNSIVFDENYNYTENRKKSNLGVYFIISILISSFV